MIRYIWILFFIYQIVFLFSQEQMSSKESYFISRQIQNDSIYPRDRELGFMEDNESIRDLIEQFMLHGPDKNNSIDYMLSVLKEKYVPLEGTRLNTIRISKNTINDNRYETDIRIIFEDRYLLCTIYLIKNKELWYIEDFQIN